ncbi:MAG: flagellar biosynthetic protein FliO [Tissierellia bacterium]|nr:flagellar biosynthetic protein FliO [Tissierellia bacterium]
MIVIIDDIIKLIISIIGIILVLYLTYYCTKWLSAKTALNIKSKYMNVVDKLMLGQNNFITILEINRKYYLVGITEKEINILKELDDFYPVPDNKEISPKFNNIFNKYKKTTDIGNSNEKKI